MSSAIASASTAAQSAGAALLPRVLTRPKDHPLFRRYPLVGEARLSVGSVPTPYHVYDGHGLFIGGTAHLGAVRQLLAPELVTPIQTQDGQALMGLWICNFTDASLGAHTELQFSIFVSRGKVAPVASHRLGLIEAMLNRPDVQMLCHGLWNNTPRAVAYNRELLALNAQLSRSEIVREARSMSFSFVDDATQMPVLQGRIANPKQQSIRANFALMARLGLRRLSALAREPWVGLKIVNPVSEALPRNAVAQSFTRNDVSVIRYFDDPAHRLAFGDTRYARLEFEPQFFQYLEGFKFVYLPPQ